MRGYTAAVLDDLPTPGRPYSRLTAAGLAAAAEDQEPGWTIVTGDSLEEYAASAVTINTDQLASEYARTPADLAYWGMLAAEAEATYQTAKDHLSRVEASALTAAHYAADQQAKRPPAARVEAMAKLAEPVQLAKAQLVQADSTRRHMRAMCDGISAKLQALISLGAQIRRELDSGKYTT